MFTTFLRIFLYITLFLCVIWGAVIVGAPRALELIVSRSFGETVIPYNLRITPKFNLLVSRIEINGAKFEGISLDGSVRSLEINIAGLFNLKPVVKISIGPSKFNGLGSINKAEARLYFPEISLRGKADVDLDLTELIYQKAFSTKFVDANGILDMRNGVLLDTNIKAKEIEGLADMDFNSSYFEGSLSSLHFLEDGVSPPASVDLYFPELNFPSKRTYLKNASIRSEFLESKYNVKITLGNVQNEKKEHVASGVSASLLTESFEFRGIEKMKVNTDILYLPASDFIERGEVIDLSINFKNNNNFTHQLITKGYFQAGDLISNELPIAKLSNSIFEITSNYKSKTNTSGELMADFIMRAENEPSISLDAAATVEVSERDVFNCVIKPCFLTNFSLNYDLVAQNENLEGFLYCPKIPCELTEFEHSFQTTNTSLFINSATTSKVFNPVFLAFLYRSLLMGEKIGHGHYVKF